MERCLDSFYRPVYRFLSQSEEGPLLLLLLIVGPVAAQALPRF